MTLHPQAKRFLDEIRAAQVVPWQDMPVAKSRELFDSMTDRFGDAPPLAHVEDRRIANIPVRIYGVPIASDTDVIVYFHGGGWVLGSIESHDALCRRLAVETNHTVVSVHYRRPPEHRAPAAAEDCFAVTAAVRKQISTTAKLYVAGDSAGGNLAATTCLLSQDRTVAIDGQVLIYPVIDHKIDSASYNRFAEGFGLTKATMAWFWQQYLGNNPTSGTLKITSLSDATISPEHPPALVLLAGHDVLYSEGIAYAEKLSKAGIEVQTEHYDDMLHGFIHFGGVFDTAARAIESISDWIAKI